MDRGGEGLECMDSGSCVVTSHGGLHRLGCVGQSCGERLAFARFQTGGIEGTGEREIALLLGAGKDVHGAAQGLQSCDVVGEKGKGFGAEDDQVRLRDLGEGSSRERTCHKIVSDGGEEGLVAPAKKISQGGFCACFVERLSFGAIEIKSLGERGLQVAEALGPEPGGFDEEGGGPAETERIAAALWDQAKAEESGELVHLIGGDEGDGDAGSEIGPSSLLTQIVLRGDGPADFFGESLDRKSVV